jgi:hypothetical protein
MRISLRLLVVFILIGLIPSHSLATQKKLAMSPRVLSAKTVYFDNQTKSDAVGNGALLQLKKWGKFQITPDRQLADLIILLSADPYKGGNIILASGQTGSIDRQGHIEEDPIPNYNKQFPARYAYLTVIDPTTGDKLWSGEHAWGGLITGFYSVGNRLMKELEKQVKNESRLSNPRIAPHSGNAVPQIHKQV